MKRSLLQSPLNWESSGQVILEDCYLVNTHKSILHKWLGDRERVDLLEYKTQHEQIIKEHIPKTFDKWSICRKQDFCNSKSQRLAQFCIRNCPLRLSLMKLFKLHVKSFKPVNTTILFRKNVSKPKEIYASIYYSKPTCL